MGRTMRALAAWGLTVCAACVVLGLPVELVSLVRASTPAGAGLGASLALVAIAPFVGLLTAPALLAATAATHMLWRRRTRLRYAFPLVTWPVGFATSWLVVDPSARLFREAYVAMCVASGVAVTVLVGLIEFAPTRLRIVAAISLIACCLGLHVWLNPDVYRELHDLAILFALAGSATALAGRQRRWLELRPQRLAAVSLGCVAAGALLALALTPAFPGWRSAAFTACQFAPPLIRLVRASTDLDRDGYSALAWGGDCDDFDRARHPGAQDPAGGVDANCNGANNPATLEPVHSGLREARGVPGYPQGTIDLVVLVTIDTVRLDALTTTAMPRVWAHAKRGLRLDQLYAGGTRTSASLGRILRTKDRSLPALLAAAGIPSVAIVPRQRSIAPATREFGAAFESRGQVDAEITDLALAHIRADDAPARQFVWAHYYAPHPPFETHAEAPARTGTRFPAAYSSELHYADEQVGRLLDALASEGYLDRAVLIVTSDHGIGLAGDRIQGYGRGGADVVARVPGFVVAPDLAAGSYPHLTSHRDIPATVLGAFAVAGADAEAERFGRSWLRLRDDRSPPLHDFVVTRSARYSSGAQDDVPLGILVTPRYKLVFDYHENLGELYDREVDPQNLRDVAAEKPDLTHDLRARLATYDDVDGYP